MTAFYGGEGVQNEDEAIVYAERHVADQDPLGYGYAHCAWCSDEWPCTAASLLHIVSGLRGEAESAWNNGYEEGWSDCLARTA